MIALKTKNLIKYFDGVKAVDNFSVEIEQGKITGIIGPNGSGKTTLVNLLTGMLSVDKGSVIMPKASEFEERQSPIRETLTRQRIKPYKIYYHGTTRTFQNIRLFEQMTVLDNILVVLTKRNIFGSLLEKDKKCYTEKAEKVLKKVDLWKKRNDLAINLSYGQRKLLEIARVLAMDKNIFLLDEPFAGLFPEMRKTVADIILELKQKGKTVVLIEHNINLIRELCDYVIVMDNGRLLAEGEPARVLAKKEVIEAYLGE